MRCWARHRRVFQPFASGSAAHVEANGFYRALQPPSVAYGCDRRKARTAGGGVAKGRSSSGVAAASANVDLVYELQPPRVHALQVSAVKRSESASAPFCVNIGTISVSSR